MNESARRQRNLTMISQLESVTALKVTAIITDLEGHGLRPRIQCAYRSPSEQSRAYAHGTSKIRFGWHNITDRDEDRPAEFTPAAMAVDILDDDHPLSPPAPFLLMLASSAGAHGMRTGIDWGLPQSKREAIRRAISDRRWYAPVALGWDPCHVEPALGISPKAAQGKIREGVDPWGEQ
jgi:hypothetical protein